MTIVLSNNLTCKQKELIVNTLFEVQEGMPFVANYYEPIYSLLANRVEDIKMPVKAIGDDLMTANENFSKKIRTFVETNSDFLDSILLNKMSKKISSSDASINIIEEYTLKLLKQTSDYESLYSIGDFTTEEKQYLKEISLTNLSSYDLLKIELELFFEKITNTEIELKPKEVVPEKKAVVVVTEDDIKAALAVEEKEEVKEAEESTIKTRGDGIYAQMNTGTSGYSDSYFADTLAEEALNDAIRFARTEHAMRQAA